MQLGNPKSSEDGEGTHQVAQEDMSKRERGRSHDCTGRWDQDMRDFITQGVGWLKIGEIAGDHFPFRETW